MISVGIFDNYLFLPLSDCIMITIKINQLVIIRALHVFGVIRTIKFQLKFVIILTPF